MTDVNEIIKSAKALGIKITSAELGTELCQCWSDRVALAQMHFDRGEMAKCERAIREANAYAI